MPKGLEQVCTDISGAPDSFDDWEQSTNPVASATACPFNCKRGYVKDESGRACNLPSQGKYVDAQGAEQVCRDISGAPDSFDDWEQSTNPVASATACPFTL